MKKVDVCEECGSNDVETKMWVNSKTGNFGAVSDGESQDNYCNGCGEHTGIVTKELWLDKNNDILEEGTDVDVDSTNENEDFRGTVDSFRDEYVIVEDQEENFFYMLPNQVEVAKD